MCIRDRATIDTLQGQLEVKDRQIEKLTEALVAAQKTAAAAQACLLYTSRCV